MLIHVHDTATARPVAALLRPGAPPPAAEIRNHLRRLVRRIRQRWRHTHFRAIARSLQPARP